jgi:anti-sigma regulatory factor (Ser/Thr protein kinase)
MEQVAQVTVPGRMDSLPTLLEFVENECGKLASDGLITFAVKLAVEEACVNIIQYGYPAGNAGAITVTMLADSERLKVIIADRATPFFPEEAPLPDLTASWEERRSGGLGWYLIREMMDQVEYEAGVNGENRLILTKALK